MTTLAESFRDSLKRVDEYRFGVLAEDGLSPVGQPAQTFPCDQVVLSSLQDLALDPAKGGKITPGSIQEAVVGFKAQALGVLPTLSRESTGSSEFVEASGKTWDVKGPVSPPQGVDKIPSKSWVFDAHHQVDKLRHDFSQGDNVLLDLSRCNGADGKELIDLLSHELTGEEKDKVLVFYQIQQNLRGPI